MAKATSWMKTLQQNERDYDALVSASYVLKGSQNDDFTLLVKRFPPPEKIEQVGESEVIQLNPPEMMIITLNLKEVTTMYEAMGRYLSTRRME